MVNIIYVKNTYIYEHPMHNCTCFMVAFDTHFVNYKLALQYETFRVLSLEFLHVRSYMCSMLYIFTVREYTYLTG